MENKRGWIMDRREKSKLIILLIIFSLISLGLSFSFRSIPLIYFTIAAYLTFVLGDSLSTYFALSFSNVIESNPLARFFMEKIGSLMGLLLPKNIAFFSLVLFIYISPSDDFANYFSFLFLTFIGSYLTVHNCYLAIRRSREKNLG